MSGTDYIGVVFPTIVMIIAVMFVCSPLGLGWNPLSGGIVIQDEKYHIEPLTVEGKYFSASDNRYNVMCNNSIMYATSNEVYTNLSINHSYLVALKVTNTTLNADGYITKGVKKSAITTTIDHIIEE